MVDNNFHFKFSLEVLNHLGRGLYRSFATVVAEAISNSWDAGATEVNIYLDKDKLTVVDNGKGMNEKDFQERFLEVGYSRRDDLENTSKRNVIGRKGIGKLAMLSISESVIIISKKEGCDITGGKINNKSLDEDIKKNKEYFLEELDLIDAKENSELDKHGTKIIFEKFKTQMNSEDIIRKYLATQFNFIFSLNKNDSFVIKVNNKEVSSDDLRELNDNTEFLWLLGGYNENIKKRFNNLAPDGKEIIEGKKLSDCDFIFNEQRVEIKGYIASVKISSNLVLRGSGGDFRAGLNLFTNGRLRQKDLMEDITTKGLAEQYLYGEIHVDGFDDEGDDRFTSSREGIIKDDLLYKEFLLKLKEIIKIVIKDWSPWRREIKSDWDVDDGDIPKYQAKMEQGRNEREKDFNKKIDEAINDKGMKKSLKDKIADLSQKNTIIYQDIFILENIFREYIKIKGVKEVDFDLLDKNQENCIENIKKTRKEREKDQITHILKDKIIKEDHYLNYLNLTELAYVIDYMINSHANKLIKNRKGMVADAQDIIPIRNPVMHTTEITKEAEEYPKIKNVIDYINDLSDKNI